MPPPGTAELEAIMAGQHASEAPSLAVCGARKQSLELEAVMAGQHASEASFQTANGAQKHSLHIERAGPPSHLHCDTQKHSPPSGIDTAAGSQWPSQLLCGTQEHSLIDAAGDNQRSPRSPTRIDPELQAQAWALLPDLARDLNKIKTSHQRPDSVKEAGTDTNKQHPDGACKTKVDRVRNPQDDMVLQSKLLQSRIPANEKGKAVQKGEGIQDEQTPISYAQATSSAAPDTAPTEDSRTREAGWEPAKVHHRKRQDPVGSSIQALHQHGDKSKGTIFFKNKMEGRCYNCFSPNHLALSCHRPPRCWKCYHSGHRAMDCSLFTRRLQYKSRNRQELHHPTSSRKLNHDHSVHKTDHRSFAEVVRGKGGMVTARYPGDPRARPAHGVCAVSATGDIRRRRDELIGRAAVKPRRELVWSYGAPDMVGERLPGSRGHDCGRDQGHHLRRDSDNYNQGRSHHDPDTRRHHSVSSWVRNPCCGSDVQDCISSNWWHGGRSRVALEPYPAPIMVWRAKKAKDGQKQKKVSFADPIATELKPPRRVIPDGSIMLIKGNKTDRPQKNFNHYVHDVLEHEINLHKTQLNTCITEGTGSETELMHDNDINMKMARSCEIEAEKVQQALAQTLKLMEVELGYNNTHFQRPIEKNKMDAIQVMIEEAKRMNKKKNISKKMAVQVGLEA